eukprot:jgi/Botrbrau1/16400/Bobra.0387s0010.1
MKGQAYTYVYQGVFQCTWRFSSIPRVSAIIPGSLPVYMAMGVCHYTEVSARIPGSLPVHLGVSQSTWVSAAHTPGCLPRRSGCLPVYQGLDRSARIRGWVSACLPRCLQVYLPMI